MLWLRVCFLCREEMRHVVSFSQEEEKLKPNFPRDCILKVMTVLIHPVAAGCLLSPASQVWQADKLSTCILKNLTQFCLSLEVYEV